MRGERQVPNRIAGDVTVEKKSVPIPRREVALERRRAEEGDDIVDEEPLTADRNHEPKYASRPHRTESQCISRACTVVHFIRDGHRSPHSGTHEKGFPPSVHEDRSANPRTSLAGGT